MINYGEIINLTEQQNKPQTPYYNLLNYDDLHTTMPQIFVAILFDNEILC